MYPPRLRSRSARGANDAPPGSAAKGSGRDPARRSRAGRGGQLLLRQATDLRDGHLARDRPARPVLPAVAPGQHLSEDHAAVGPDHGDLSGRDRRAGVHRGRGADRAAAARYPGARVLQDVVLERRIDGDPGVLRHLAGPGSGRRRRPEPGADRHAPDPAAGAAARHHGVEGADRHPDGPRADIGRSSVGRGGPEQLRQDLHPGRDRPSRRRRPGADVRRPAVRDAGQPRPRSDGAPRVDGDRRDRRDQRAELDQPVGRIGREPAPPGTQFTIPVTTVGRLSTPEEFANIILRARPDGSVLRVRDVGTVQARIAELRQRDSAERQADGWTDRVPARRRQCARRPRTASWRGWRSWRSTFRRACTGWSDST